MLKQKNKHDNSHIVHEKNLNKGVFVFQIHFFLEKNKLDDIVPYPYLKMMKTVYVYMRA